MTMKIDESKHQKCYALWSALRPPVVSICRCRPKRNSAKSSSIYSSIFIYLSKLKASYKSPCPQIPRIDTVGVEGAKPTRRSTHKTILFLSPENGDAKSCCFALTSARLKVAYPLFGIAAPPLSAHQPFFLFPLTLGEIGR